MVEILLTHPPEARAVKYGERALAELSRLGTLRLHEGPEPMATAELIEAARGCAIIVADRLTEGRAELFQARPELVAFVRGAVDVRNIDLEAASRAGVLVARAGPHFVPGVVELILGQMVDLARELSGYVIAYRQGRMPEGRMGVQLAGKTAGIIGFGNLGGRLAKILTGLEMRVLVHDPYVAKVPDGIERAERERLLAESDFVICVPIHSPETDRMIDEAFLRQMKPGAFLLNPSRGAVADEDALERALSEGWIRGAALDVGSEPDDIPPVRLGRLPNVIAAPHIGGLIPESSEAQARDTVEAVHAILDGRLPEHSLNAERATRLRKLAAGAGG